MQKHEKVKHIYNIDIGGQLEKTSNIQIKQHHHDQMINATVK